MKRRICVFIMLFLMCHIYAQLVYHDASKFPLLGKATEATGARYERLPDSLKNISRAPLWNLSRNSAGMAIRFRSNSTTIAAKWEALINFHLFYRSIRHKVQNKNTGIYLGYHFGNF